MFNVFFSPKMNITPQSPAHARVYLKAAYDKVQYEGDDGAEVHQVHGLLEEAPLAGWANEPHQVLNNEEEDGTILWNVTMNLDPASVRKKCDVASAQPHIRRDFFNEQKLKPEVDEIFLLNDKCHIDYRKFHIAEPLYTFWLWK
jgi:hypothetical protein